MIDPTRYLLTQYKGTTTLQTFYFATIQDKYLEQTSYGLKLSANYIIKYITINRIEKESTFLITYPNTTKALLNLTLDTCRIDYEGLTFNLNRCRVNNMTREIFIQGGLDIEIAANKNVTITFGPIETPITQLSPGYFTVRSFVALDFIFNNTHQPFITVLFPGYLIDEIGLDIT